jgi:NAD(P)-dependent dehydrogenase (short-subunit alcohol dehydrogenase family)
VLALAEEGCDVAFCARRAEPLEELAAEVRSRFGRRAVPIQADLLVAADCERAVAEAAAGLGGLDIVVNNAGASVLGAFGEVEDDAFWAGVELKLRGYVRVTRAALPLLRAGGQDGPGGRGGVIVNVSGNTGKFPWAQSMSGGAANAGVMNFTVALAQEVARDGIRVVGLAPGGVDTARFRTRVLPAVAAEQGISLEEARATHIAGLPLGRIPAPEEVGGVIAFLASERCANATGTTLVYDGGLTAGL